MSETPKKKRRWLRRVLVSLLVFIVALAIFGPMLVGTILASTLKSMVAAQLNAELQMDGVTYSPPYQVVVNDARLIGKDDEGRSAALFEIKSIDLKLAKLPFGSGPLVIKELLIQEPTIRIIQTDKGVIGQTGLLKDTGPSDPNMKLSDMFELRRVKIDGGRFVYEDRRDPQRPVVEWKGVGINLNTHPEDRANYAYNFQAQNLPMATMQAQGRMNIDTLFFDLEKFVLEVQADVNSIPSQLPSKLQELWKQYQISGKLILTAKGQVPLKELDKCLYDATIELKNASAFLVEEKMPLDSVNMKIAVNNLPAAGVPAAGVPTAGVPAAGVPTAGVPAVGAAPSTQPALQPLDAPINVRIDTLQAASGDLAINLKRGKITFDPAGLSWKVEDIAGRVSFPDDRPKALADLPGPLNTTHTRGNVPVTIAGQGKTTLAGGATTQNVTNYSLQMTATNGELYFTKHRIPLTGIRSDIVMTPAGITINKFDAAPMKGKMTYARGELKFDDALSWSMSGNFRDMDLSLLAPALIDDPEGQRHFSGRGSVVGSASGAFTAEDSAGKFKAKGEASVVNGNFWQLGVMQEVAKGAKADRAALTLGEAAGVFQIYNRKVYLDQAAVSAPGVLGVQGSGQIGFDGIMDMTLVAAPFGADWKKGLEKTDIPILSDIGAAIVGGVQDVTQGVTKHLLYEIQVSGPAKNPRSQTIPAPLLTSGLFEDMAQNRIEKQRLLDAIKKMPPPKKKGEGKK